jgi:hypothetical protein
VAHQHKIGPVASGELQQPVDRLTVEHIKSRRAGQSLAQKGLNMSLQGCKR